MARLVALTDTSLGVRVQARFSNVADNRYPSASDLNLGQSHVSERPISAYFRFCSVLHILPIATFELMWDARVSPCSN